MISFLKREFRKGMRGISTVRPQVSTTAPLGFTTASTMGGLVGEEAIWALVGGGRKHATGKSAPIVSSSNRGVQKRRKRRSRLNSGRSHL